MGKDKKVYNNSFSDRYFLGKKIDQEIKSGTFNIKPCGMGVLTILHAIGYDVVLSEIKVDKKDEL